MFYAFVLKCSLFGGTSESSKSSTHYLKCSLTYRFCPRETSYVRLGVCVGEGGGGVAAVMFLCETSWKSSIVFFENLKISESYNDQSTHVTFLRGGGGEVQRNEHRTFLVDIIDM